MEQFWNTRDGTAGRGMTKLGWWGERARGEKRVSTEVKSEKGFLTSFPPLLYVSASHLLVVSKIV